MQAIVHTTCLGHCCIHFILQAGVFMYCALTILQTLSQLIKTLDSRGAKLHNHSILTNIQHRNFWLVILPFARQWNLSQAKTALEIAFTVLGQEHHKAHDF